MPAFFFSFDQELLYFSPAVLCLATGGATQAILKATSVPHFILIAKCEGIVIHVILVLKLCVYIKSIAVHKPPLAATYGPNVLFWRPCVLLPLSLC